MEEEIASKSGAKFDYHSSRILGVVFPAVYASILCVFCLAYRVIPGPELIVLCFFIYAAYNKRSRRFVKDGFHLCRFSCVMKPWMGWLAVCHESCMLASL